MNLSDKVSISYHPNIETYFIAERLAVQHIGNMVFTFKDTLYAHQPLVFAAYSHFKPFANTPCLRRIAELIAIFRDKLHDNNPFLQYIVHLPPFPEKKEAVPFKETGLFEAGGYPQMLDTAKELADSLRSFYQQAHVGDFIKTNKRFYLGVRNEVIKDIKVSNFSAMERYYGESFLAYRIYLMPTMPIPNGVDNFRAFGPVMEWPSGKLATMFFSSTVPLPVEKSLSLYKQFGFNNPPVTRLLTVHEFAHSFVNPHVETYKTQIQSDSALFTPAFQKALATSYINSWYGCVVEHLVRLGEIRIALAMNDKAEADRLRAEHGQQYHFVLLPLLEEKISQYKKNRSEYPNFKSFLPQLLTILHQLTPMQVDELVKSKKSD